MDDAHARHLVSWRGRCRALGHKETGAANEDECIRCSNINLALRRDGRRVQTGERINP